MQTPPHPRAYTSFPASLRGIGILKPEALTLALTLGTYGHTHTKHAKPTFFPSPVSASLPVGKLEVPPLLPNHWLLASLLIDQEPIGDQEATLQEHTFTPYPPEVLYTACRWSTKNPPPQQLPTAFRT